MTGAPLRLWAGRSGWRCGNAGDEFSGPLIEALTGRPVHIMATPAEAQLFAGGSILHQLPGDWRGAVWGSGLIEEGHRVACPGAQPFAVRGPLTRARWLTGEPTTIGDPGLLVADVWPRSVSAKRYTIGIVPHYIDGDNAAVANMARRYTEQVTIIDICGRVADVLRLMTECDTILSSSLHGLIFADAYDIPNAWVHLSDKLVGGSFKFRDYYGLSQTVDPMPIPFDGCNDLHELAAAIRAGYAERDQLGTRREDQERIKDGLRRSLAAAVEWIDADGVETDPEPEPPGVVEVTERC